MRHRQLDQISTLYQALNLVHNIVKSIGQPFSAATFRPLSLSHRFPYRLLELGGDRSTSKELFPIQIGFSAFHQRAYEYHVHPQATMSDTSAICPALLLHEQTWGGHNLVAASSPASVQGLAQVLSLLWISKQFLLSRDDPSMLGSTGSHLRVTLLGLFFYDAAQAR